MGVIEVKVDGKIEKFERKNRDYLLLSEIADEFNEAHDGL